MKTLYKYLLLFAVSCFVSGTPQNRYAYYPRFFRSIANIPYLPPTIQENESKQPYLPPQADQYLNYIPPSQADQENPNNYYFVPEGSIEELPADFGQGVRIQSTGPQGQATGEARGDFVNVQTETQQFPSGQFCDCSERQVAGGSDIEVDLPRGEPEGYDYPKPIKRLELPGVKPLVRTLDQELPIEENPTTTETASEANETETTTNPIAINELPDPNRLTRSSLLSQKVQTKPESGPVYIKTLPFQLEPRAANYMYPMENHPEAKRAAQYYQGDPTKWLQISQPKPAEPQQRYRQNQQSRPAVRPATRPYPIQISPPAPANYRPQGQPQIQISPPAPPGYRPRF